MKTLGYNPKWENPEEDVIVEPLADFGVTVAISALETEFAELRAAACAKIELGEGGSQEMLAEAKGIKHSIKVLKGLLNG